MTVSALPDGHEPAALLTPQHVADRLTVSRSQVYALIKQRRIRALRIGALVRIEPGELERFIEAARRS